MFLETGTLSECLLQYSELSSEQLGRPKRHPSHPTATRRQETLLTLVQ